ncbi:MAG: hypothetical protein ACREOK_00605 [Gemmatimonadaceae bacterium]
MPVVRFNELPDHARVWVFASDRPLMGAEGERLLDGVDAYLEQWKAHGAPLRSARELRDDRFLAIGVDPTAEQASGCSIDALFRRLQDVERELGTSLVAGGRVFYRGADGEIQVARRADVTTLSQTGELTHGTSAFDTSITDAQSWRERFERPARETWIASLLPRDQDSQPSSRSATKASSARKG